MPINNKHRNDRIFDLVVDSYIETAEPVGSQMISKRSKLGLSSATIRNIMVDLEAQGFLKQPHTSAGRVPTDRGYRYWVDNLMTPQELSREEKEKILKELARAKTVSSLAERMSKVISELTDSAALIYIKNLRRASLLTIMLEELLEHTAQLDDFFEEEDGFFLEGAIRIFEQPEFQDLVRMRQLLQMFDEKEDLMQILLSNLEHQGVNVHIGSENPTHQLDNVSVVVKYCSFSNSPVGGVGVVGPTRMRYPKVVAVVGFVADSVSQAMNNLKG